MRIQQYVTGLAVALVLALASGKAMADQPLVKAELLANATVVEPGGTFLVGVKYTIKPQWHVYWHNPGDAGLPTEIKWTLPEGWSVGELHWPLPIQFNQPGDVIGYGYEEELLLVAEVTVPANAEVGQQINLAAASSWLVCKETCIPGDTTVQLTVTVGESRTAAHEATFAAWAKRLPKADGLPEGVSITSTSGSIGETVSISVAFDQPVKQVEAMPYQISGLSVRGAAVSMDDTGRQANVRLSTRKFSQATTAGDSLPILLVWQDDQGKRHGGVYVFKP